MKQFLTVLLCLLLVGCVPQNQEAPPAPAPQVPSEPAITGFYDPHHPMEARYPGQIRSYPMTQQKVHGMLCFGSDVLILSGQDNTTLMLLTGHDLHQTAARTVGFELTREDPSLRVHPDSLSYYDPRHGETVVLDQKLRETRRIAVPRDISGKPILSYDAKTLYYCTPWAVVAWDLETGIRRTVKEIQYTHQELTSLLWDDRVLCCRLTDEDQTTVQLLSAENGMVLHTLPEGATLSTLDSGYFLTWTDGFQPLMVFSRDTAEPRLLLPENPVNSVWYLGNHYAALTVRTGSEEISLDYYNLETGTLQASLNLDAPQTPKSIADSSDGGVYILVYDPAADRDTLYRWEIPAPSSDTATAVHTFPYHADASADPEAMARCRELADSIGRKYGISIKIGEEACQVQPWDYTFLPEHLAPVLEKELRHLEQRLARYPQEILRQTAAHFPGLTVCLVRKISGNTESGSLSTPTGIQFFKDNHAYVAITVGNHSEQALYHELYHVMETHILTNSSALDPWEDLNPADFVYGQEGLPDIYLQGQTQAFVDRYSTQSPKEDRARVFENAMLTGQESRFRSEYMQRKLSALCQGIRQAYGLKKTADILPWEQYLVTPLTPNL